MDEDLEFDYLFKVIMVGDSGVGKSNLGARFTRDEFMKGSKPTIGVDFAGKTIEVEGSKVRAQIWDTAGQERFKAVSSTYYRNAAAAMVIYDITNRKSFGNVPTWIKELRSLADHDVVIMMVGNKTDLDHLRAVSTEDGKSLAEQEKILFMETSALSGANVVNAFRLVLASVMEVKRKSGKLVNVDKGIGQVGEKDKDKEDEFRSGLRVPIPDNPQPSDRKPCC